MYTFHIRVPGQGRRPAYEMPVHAFFREDGQAFSDWLVSKNLMQGAPGSDVGSAWLVEEALPVCLGLEFHLPKGWVNPSPYAIVFQPSEKRDDDLGFPDSIMVVSKGKLDTRPWREKLPKPLPTMPEVVWILYLVDLAHDLGVRVPDRLWTSNI